MKKEKEIGKIVVATRLPEQRKIVRVQKSQRRKERTTLNINKSVIGDSIEIMMERLREGEGEESIQDRDLVYNDNESGIVNPITNIRSDKFELMLEEKIGQYEHEHRPTMKVVKEEEAEKPKEDNGTEGKE